MKELFRKGSIRDCYFWLDVPMYGKPHARLPGLATD